MKLFVLPRWSEEDSYFEDKDKTISKEKFNYTSKGTFLYTSSNFSNLWQKARSSASFLG